MIEEEAMDIDEISNATNQTASENTNKTTPDKEATIAPHPHIPTNNGTHRITVKWTLPTDITEFDNDKRRINEALFTLMKTLFRDEDGAFYRWGSDQDMVETKAASSLTEVTARSRLRFA